MGLFRHERSHQALRRRPRSPAGSAIVAASCLRDSAVLPVELRSALRRRVSEGSLDGERVPEILKRFAGDRAFWTSVGVSTEVLAAAETLVASHPLRALDAIHVASAQLFATRLTAPRLIFVSADARQTTAAAAVGLTTRQIRPEGPAAPVR